MNRLDLEEFNGFIGLPIPLTDVRIAGDAGEPLAIGEQGELCLKGPQVMQGYWQNAEATRGAFTPDVFFALVTSRRWMNKAISNCTAVKKT